MGCVGARGSGCVGAVVEFFFFGWLCFLDFFWGQYGCHGGSNRVWCCRTSATGPRGVVNGGGWPCIFLTYGL